MVWCMLLWCIIVTAIPTTVFKSWFMEIFLRIITILWPMVIMLKWVTGDMAVRGMLSSSMYSNTKPTNLPEMLRLYSLAQIWIFSTQNRSFIGWLHTICNSMLLWNDLLSSPLNWCFNDAWNVQISSVSFISVLRASLKIGHRCFYVIFMRLELSIQRERTFYTLHMGTGQQMSIPQIHISCQNWNVSPIHHTSSNKVPRKNYILDILSVRKFKFGCISSSSVKHSLCGINCLREWVSPHLTYYGWGQKRKSFSLIYVNYKSNKEKCLQAVSTIIKKKISFELSHKLHFP